MKNLTLKSSTKMTLLAIVSLIAAFLLFGNFVEPVAAQTPEDEACRALDELNSGANCENSGDGSAVTGLAADVVTWLSYIVGFLSVIMIIVGGFRFLTSGGDAGKVASARSTLIYAVVGLVVAIFAQAIVAFVINESTGN